LTDKQNRIPFIRYQRSVEAKCKIELLQDEQNYFIRFTANIFRHFLILLAGILFLFVITTAKMIPGQWEYFLYASLIAVIVFSLMSLIGYLNIKSILYDFVYYRLMWKYYKH
jgi:hypothetical protein